MADEDLSIDNTLRKLQFLFTLSGVDVENKKHNYKQKFILFFNLFWMNRDVAGAVYLLIEEILNGNDFVHITYNAPCITYSNMSNIKLLSIVYSSRKVNELIGVLKDLERAGTQRGIPLTADKKIVIRQERSFLHRLLQVLIVAYSVLIVAFAVNPVSITIYKYVRYNVVDLMLPFLIKYPFDAYNIYYWPWVYLHQIVTEIFDIGNVATVDFLFYTLCTYIRIQFRLLQHDIEHLIADKSKSLKEIEQKFRHLVQWHNECIRAASMLDDIYSKATLCNFVSSSILICLTGFDVMVISDVMIMVTFMSFLGTSLLQIYFLCFFGDLVMKSSMEVGDAVYKSQWYMKDANVSRNLLLILIRSQRACRLTAYKFGDVNLRSFMRILSNAWSYFALLNTIYG